MYHIYKAELEIQQAMGDLMLEAGDDIIEVEESIWKVEYLHIALNAINELVERHDEQVLERKKDS